MILSFLISMRNILLLFFCLFGCSNINSPTSPISGCTDPSATNYNNNATTDNLTCLYSQNDSYHAMNSLWFGSISDNKLEIGYTSNIGISGFQFTVVGAVIENCSGGVAEESSFSVISAEPIIPLKYI